MIVFRWLILAATVAMMTGLVSAEDIQPAPHYKVPAVDAISNAISLAVQTSDWNSTPPVRLQVPGIENAWQFNRQIFAGDSPPGPEAMDALRGMGISTLVSIDMAPPDQWEAAGHDLDYVHVPIRHGRLNPADYMRVLRVISYMKAHYYLHAGPGDDRAMAIAAMATHVSEFRPSARVLYLLDAVSYPKDEVGLWYVAGSNVIYKTLDDSRRWPSDFPRALPAPPMIWWMRNMDESFQVLREANAHGWETPPDAVGTTAAYEAATLARMAQSWIESHSQAEEEMRRQMNEVQGAATRLESAMKANDAAGASAAWTEISNACLQCHQQFRDK